jgi:hypothetical protein
VGEESHVKFTLQSKNEMYLNFESAIYREPGDPLRFSYPADHELAGAFEEQMTTLVREYKGMGSTCRSITRTHRGLGRRSGRDGVGPAGRIGRRSEGHLCSERRGHA